MTRLFGKNKGSYSAVENTPDHSIPANPKAMDGLVANEMENLIDLSNRINLCAEMLLRNTQKDNLVAIRETLAKALKVLATAAEFNNIANKMLGNLHDTRNQRKDIYLASLNELNTEIEAAAIKHSINIATQDINERSRIETQLKLSRMSRITFDTVTKKEFANRQVHELLESDIKNVLIPSYRKDREVRYNTPPDIENIKTHVASIQGLLKTTPDAPITRTTPSYLEESAREQSSADTLSRAGNIIFHPTVVHAAAAIVITAASTTPAAAVTLGAIIASTALKTREQKTLNDIRREYELLHEYSYLNQATVSLQNELARNHPLQMHQHFAMHKPFSYNDITEKRVSDQTKYLHKAAQQESGDATANTIDASANITIPTASIATHPEASELAHLTTEIAAAGSLAGVGIISIALSITQRRVINDMLHKVSLDMHELRNDVPYYSSHTELADMIKQKKAELVVLHTLAHDPTLDQSNFAQKLQEAETMSQEMVGSTHASQPKRQWLKALKQAINPLRDNSADTLRNTLLMSKENSETLYTRFMDPKTTTKDKERLADTISKIDGLESSVKITDQSNTEKLAQKMIDTFYQHIYDNVQNIAKEWTTQRTQQYKPLHESSTDIHQSYDHEFESVIQALQKNLAPTTTTPPPRMTVVNIKNR